MHQRIKVYMAPGEGDREQAMRSVLSHDIRFEPLQVDSTIPVDLQFAIDRFMSVDIMDRPSEINIPHRLNIELKLPIDFVQSVLNGHLMDQTLSMRESGYNGCTVVLGDLGDIAEAIRDSSKLRSGKYLRGDELRQAISSNHLRCKSFRKRSMLNGIPVFYKGDDSGFFDGDDQWKDILDLSYDFLCDGDLLGFRVRPAENDRDVCAAATLFKGIGSDSMRELLKDYDLMFCPKPGARPIEEIPGFGKKRCDQIRARVSYK